MTAVLLCAGAFALGFGLTILAARSHINKYRARWKQALRVIEMLDDRRMGIEHQMQSVAGKHEVTDRDRRLALMVLRYKQRPPQ